MGWYYFANTRAELVAELRKDDRIVGSRLVGSHLWQVYQYANGIREVVLFKLGTCDGLHGYKCMAESMGPYFYDCPLPLLELAEPAPTEEWAVEWRRKVREHHEKRKHAKVGKVVGATVAYGKRKYRLRENLGRRGWEVLCLDDGLIYRMKAPQVNKAELVPIDAEVAA